MPGPSVVDVSSRAGAGTLWESQRSFDELGRPLRDLTFCVVDLETTGGSPFAAFFTIDYDDVGSLVTSPDPAFPFQVAGVARAFDGTSVGGVRHQFRDTHNGFLARLTVEFPLPTLPSMVSGHRWHLACEFSNWIEESLAR